MLLRECLCGSKSSVREERHGLELRRCRSCGVIRQHVDLTPEEYAAFYESAYHDGVYTHTRDHDLAVAALRLDEYALPAGARVLDIGCGNGAFVEAARGRGLTAVGQEVAWQAESPPIYVGPLETLNFPAAAFDVVTLHDVLEHIPSPAALLAEVHRVLRPEGKLIVDFPRFHHESGVHHWKPVEHLWLLTEAEVVRVLTEAGFTVHDIRFPIPSKVVLYADTPAVEPTTILVPPGIGDGWWVAAKLRSFCEQRNIYLPEVWVHEAGPRRSARLWERLPFATFGGYAEGISREDPAVRAAYRGTVTMQKDVLGFDYFLSMNGHVDHGGSLEEAWPGDVEWDLPLFRPKAEDQYTIQSLRRWGSYVVVGVWDHGFYKHWLKQFGEPRIVAALRRIADANFTVVVTGASWDAGRIASRVAAADRRFVSLVGQTNFDELTGLVRGAAGVFGFPAGSTMLGPFVDRPTVLLWNGRFPEAMWRNAVPPRANYHPVGTAEADPRSVADLLLREMR